MSSFSECLNEIKNCRQLTVAQIAELCSINKTVAFRWFNGSYLPESANKLKILNEKLRLTTVEREKLRETYEKEVLGEIHSKRFHCIIDIFQTLEQNRAEYMNSISELYSFSKNFRKYNGTEHQQNVMQLNSKMDVLQCIQNELAKNAFCENSHICLKIQSSSEALVMQLKRFCNSVDNGSLDILMGIGEETYDSCVDKLKMIKDMLALMPQKDFVQIYRYGCPEQMEQDGQNWLLADDFFLQFSEDLSYGILSRDVEWIAFFRNMFDEAKENGALILKNRCEPLDYVLNYDGGSAASTKPERIYAIEYMPCLSLGLTEGILHRHIYQQMPGREELIQAILALFPERAKRSAVEVKSLFAGEGLEEFMETGRVDIFPYDIYEPLDMQERCLVLHNILELAKKNPEMCFMRMRDDFLNVKGIHVEERLQNDSRLIIEVHFDKSKNEQIEITDEKIRREFKYFMEYLMVSDYIYSREETRIWMQKVLEKYEGMCE